MDDLCFITSSQEELLQRVRFVGDSQLDDDNASQFFGELPVAADGILMMSQPNDTQEGFIESSGTQDVFHTPPEESSLPISSDEQRSNMAGDGDRCAVNPAVDTDCGTEVFGDFCEYSDREEFVDLGRDLDLGFSEPQLTQVIVQELVTECSRSVEGDCVGDDSACQFDDFWISERGLCELGELPAEKLKLSEQNLGFHDWGDCFGLELQKVGVGTSNCKGKLASEDCSRSFANEGNCCREISIDKELGSGENFENRVVQVECIETDRVVHLSEAETESPGSLGDDLQHQEDVRDGDNCCRDIPETKTVKIVEAIKLFEASRLVGTVERNKSSDDVNEGSERKERNHEEPQFRVLPSSLRGCLDNEEKGRESGKGGKKDKKEKCSVFDVLKALTEDTSDVEDDFDSVCWLKVAKLGGLTFPTPRWWPNNGNFKKQRLV